MARAFRHLPVLLFRHNLIDMPDTTYKQNKCLRKLKNLSRFVFVSEFSANHFKLHWPEFSDRVHVVPNAISKQAWFSPAATKRQQKFIYLGRPIEVKGFAEFCQGIVPVLNEHSEWKAQILVYEWERHRKYAQPIIEQVKRLTDNVDVFIERPLPEVQRLVKEADIAVVPSKWDEPFGLAALEAHFAGLAVISSGRGGLREISGEYAYYLDDVTPEAISNALFTLITNKDLREQLKESGQARCVEQFDPVKIIERYDKIKQTLSRPR